MALFQILAHPDAKAVDFGILLAPSWVPNDPENRLRGAKNDLRKLPGGLHWADLLPTSLLERSWAPLWASFDALEIDLIRFWGAPWHPNHKCLHDIFVIFDEL